MRTLLNDLLDLSKIEAGRMSFETACFDFRQSTVDLISFWGFEARDRSLRLRVEGSRKLPRWLLGDPTRIRQILNNLISNALKFTSSGSVTLRFDIDEANELLITEVRGTGPGMPTEQLGRLFGAFDQLHASTARKFGGTGLGLNISRKLARLMGGDLTADSQVGAGSTFRFTMPLALAEGPAVQTQDDANEMQARLKILIVDDHHVNRRAFSLILEAVCDEVSAVESGEHALDLLAVQPFDVVLMDLNMPGIGGLATVGRLRATAGPNQGTKVIVLSASVSPADIDKCRAAGMDAFVRKPVEPEELIAAIADLFEAGPEAGYKAAS